MDEAATTSNRGDGPVDLYREVHKGLRLALFDLTAAAGSLDRSDETGAKAFATLFADVEMMLAIDEQRNVEFAFGYINANHASSFVHRSYLPRMQALANVSLARPKLPFGLIERDMSRSTYLTRRLLA